MRRNFCNSSAICFRRARICFSDLAIVRLPEIKRAGPALPPAFWARIWLAMIHPWARAPLIE